MIPPRVLIAGAGNLLLGDDGFGVAVAAHLARDSLPEGVVVRDYGIRGLHLAYELLEPPQLLIVVDAVSRGQPPGTLFVIEHIGDEAPAGEGDPASADPHGMTLPAVFAGVAALGVTLPRVLIVGCEPGLLEESIGLSPAVEQAIEPAAHLVRRLVERELATTPSTAPPFIAAAPAADPGGDRS